MITSNGTWSGNTPMTFAYQWQLCNSLGGKCRDIIGATNNTYKPVSTDINLRVRSVVTATNAAGSSSQPSLPTELVRPDSTPPTVPSGLRVGSAGQTSLSVAWTASTDGVGVAGYGVYRDGVPVGITQATSYSVVSLSCGKSYTIAVDAYDALGNRSAKASMIASTAPCGSVTDTQAPSAPTGLTKTGATVTSISISWSASTDNVGVTGYGKYRNGSMVSASTGTTYTFSGLTCGTSYTLAVDAFDAAGNRSTKASMSASTAGCGLDTIAPAVSLTAPASGAVVTGTIPVSANASDNVGVAGVQFKVDGANVSAEDTSSPFGALWNTATVANGNHTLTAVARDASGNTTTSLPVVVSVNNVGPAPTPTGLVAAYSFDAGSGSTLTDLSGHGNTGTINNATWSTAGRFGNALSFNGSNSWVTIPGSTSLNFSSGMTLEAWVKPSALGSSWRAVMVKEQPSQLIYALYAHDGGPGPSGHVFVGGQDRYSSGSLLPTNSWTHLAATYDGTALRLYVNGVVATTLPVAGPIATSSDPLRIGGDSVWPEWFSGLIDEARVYNRALSPTEIEADMIQPVGESVSPVPASPTDTAPPTTPTGLTATSTTQTSVALSWIASTDNVGVIGYGSYKNGTLAGTGTATSYIFSGLTCGTTYTFAVDAYDAAGNRSSKAATTVSTSPCVADTIPPSVPDNQIQSAATETTITTSWSPSTDNVGVVGYRLYKNDVLVATVAQTSYTFTGLTCGTTYTIGLEAVDAAGNTSNRIFAEGPMSTTPCNVVPVDSISPTSPTALQTSAIGQTSITLSWGASSDNTGVSGYGEYLNGGLVSSTTGTSFTFTGLTCGTTYLLGVDAYDAAGNRSTTAALNATTSACSGGDVTAPMTPTGLATSGISQTSITLSWTASTDNVGVAGYGRYRDGALLSSGTATSYTFSGLTCGTTYSLGVDAFDAAGNRSARAAVNATTSACSAPPPSSANLYLSPSGSDSNPCTQSQPCASIGRAYSLAQLGQTVELAGGTYSASQSLSGSKSGTGVVTFRPASGATVNFSSDLNLNGQNHIELQNMSFDNWYVKYSSDITFRNVNTRFFFVRVSDNVRLLGGSVGPSQDSTSPTIGGYDASSPSRNILLDGVTFHDIGRQLSPGGHVECLFVQESSGVTIRNSKFRNCDVMDVYVNPIFGGQVSNLTVENNWFDQPRPSGYYAFDMSIQPNLRVSYNSWAGTFRLSEGAWSNAVVVGNVGSLNNCSVTGVIWDHNVWDNQKCSGSTDIVAPSGFVDESGFNLHLAPGAAAANRGDPASYPSTDIDGQSRPMGGAPDAGSDEAG